MLNPTFPSGGSALIIPGHPAKVATPQGIEGIPMAHSAKVLGILKPIGGGAPVALRKDTVLVGRRSSSDVCLDFENVSGKHCELKFAHGLWHIKDLGSRNGTTVNGLKISSEQRILPDVEFGIASHHYTIEYEPAGPANVVGAAELMDLEDEAPVRQRKSLMELAGFETDSPRKSYRPSRPPEEIERLSADQGSFEDPLPAHLPPAAPLPVAEASDDDFFNMIAEDLGPKRK